ncbi:MAG TPA: RNA polymerase sigma factor [Pseudonocardiaceae bacterium]|nr:RNA polymerase sigma factor [Pseudonocardiaceae bacterium]
MDRTSEFRELYDAHRVAVHAYFVGRTGDRWAAADLMQEVFLRAWQRFDELRGRPADGRRAWLFTVARNLSVDAYRHERGRADAEAALRHEPAVGSPSAHAAVVAADRVAVVSDAIAALPEHQRVTLALATSGLNSSQIATALGVPAGTVRYRLSDARRTLADALARYDRPEHGTEEP